MINAWTTDQLETVNSQARGSLVYGTKAPPTTNLASQRWYIKRPKVPPSSNMWESNSNISSLPPPVVVSSSRFTLQLKLNLDNASSRKDVFPRPKNHIASTQFILRKECINQKCTSVSRKNVTCEGRFYKEDKIFEFSFLTQRNYYLQVLA